ncbi:MAG: hypothetical protein LBR90_04355, partial [Elusimicrobiota bacterium]|nr:hypothetical protein [Elusimicrobiota bacterium]
AAAALLKRMQNPQISAGKIFHFGDAPVTLKQFINYCFQYAGLKPNTADAPAAQLQKQNYDFAKLNPYFNPFDYVLATANAQLLGWKHSPREKWLKEIVQYYVKLYNK